MDVAVKQGRARGVYGCVEMNAATDKGGRLSVQSRGGVRDGRALYSKWDNDRTIDTRLEDMSKGSRFEDVAHAAHASSLHNG